MDPTLGRLIGCRWESYNDADWLMMENIENEMIYGWLYSFGQRTSTGLWILFGLLNKSHLTCKEVIQ